MTPEARLHEWLPYRTPPCRPPRVRLIVLPHAGGSAREYHSWRPLLPADVDLCAAQPPGREQRVRQVPLRDAGELAAALVDDLEPLWSAPVVLAGHSMGALLAFETARRLRRVGAPDPLGLIASGMRPPQARRRSGEIHRLGREALLDELIALGGTPEEIREYDELVDVLLPTVRADFALCERYRYRDEAPLDLPIHAYVGNRDRLASARIAAGWRRHSAVSFDLRVFDGGHFFVTERRAEVVRTVAADLAAWTAPSTTTTCGEPERPHHDPVGLPRPAAHRQSTPKG